MNFSIMFEFIKYDFLLRTFLSGRFKRLAHRDHNPNPFLSLFLNPNLTLCSSCTRNWEILISMSEKSI